MGTTDVRIQFLRGTTAENDAYTGLEGEIVAAVDNKTLRLHDGLAAGGFVIGTTLSTATTGTQVELDFSKNTAYEVTLTGSTNVSFTGLRDGTLNELIVKFNGLISNTVVWPTNLMWMKPDGSYTNDSSLLGFPFTETDWIVFWTNDNTGNIYTKLMR